VVAEEHKAADLFPRVPHVLAGMTLRSQRLSPLASGLDFFQTIRGEWQMSHWSGPDRAEERL
jgi:hypothetical protein